MSRRERAGHRRARLEHILAEELDAILRADLSDPCLEELSLTALELSPDCRHVRVWFTHPDLDAADRALDRAGRFIRACLAERVSIKRAPELRFERDPRLEVKPCSE